MSGRGYTLFANNNEILTIDRFLIHETINIYF
jgi:hypothetical protein